MGKATVKHNREINLLLTDLCIMCYVKFKRKTKLILDANGEYNEYRCCSKCIDVINHDLRQAIKPHKKGAGSMCIRTNVAQIVSVNAKRAE